MVGTVRKIVGDAVGDAMGSVMGGAVGNAIGYAMGGVGAHDSVFVVGHARDVNLGWPPLAARFWERKTLAKKKNKGNGTAFAAKVVPAS
jgi:hypothetical protein